MTVTDYARSFFLFKRDLRITDNTGLIEASMDSKTVLPLFVFDPRQGAQNPYFSSNSFHFMLESLDDLSLQVKAAHGRLSIFCGRPEMIVNRLLDEKDVEAVFVNEDYTPFSWARDAAIAKVCQKSGVAFRCCPDVLLHKPTEVLKDDRKPYTIFSHFLNKARSVPVRPINTAKVDNLSNSRLASEQSNSDGTVKPPNERTGIHGGRQRALEVLTTLHEFVDYASDRDYPAKNATTRLSAHHKFGTLSIREAYHAIAAHLGLKHQLVVELFWRDFYSHIGYFFPHIFRGSFHPQFDALRWDADPAKFSLWCAGKTGFPIVDAGMRELNATGFLHNRVRMIVASFLTKDLHLDWRWGERYFAQKLVDYDPAVNNGNWQWCASTGCDAQPYFRIFNPWLQQKRYDADCTYIKAWIPELRAIAPSIIHSLDKCTDKMISGYPAPIVDHLTETSRAKDAYRKIAKGL